MVLHFALCHFFMMTQDMGIVGAAIATNITYCLNMVLLEIILWRNQRFEKTRVSLMDTKALFKNWG